MTEHKAKRKVSVFRWSAVDDAVLRALLRQVLLDARRDDEARAVGKLSGRALVTSATASMGQPPRTKAFSVGVIDVLLRSWLPKADVAVVDNLTRTVRLGLSGPALQEPVNTKAQQIAFLRKRRRTTGFVTNVRKTFVSAHRVQVEVAARNGEKAAARDVVRLQGEDVPRDRPWYPHQVDAQKELAALSSSGARFAGRVVLPTGAGKTDTVVGWLLDELRSDPTARVLWLVHQQELVDQAIARFRALARHEALDFSRIARAIHSSASSVSTLADDGLDVAALTYQTFRDLTPAKGRVLAKFLQRPTFVIVDEAHHAASPSYAELLETIDSATGVRGLVGLTATPFPTAAGARQRFEARFPHVIASVEPLDLINAGILASPIITTVNTQVVPEVSAAEIRQAIGSDLPAQVLARLDETGRNRLIVRTWFAHRNEWGKTLLFATRIDHADRLAQLLRDQKVPARALHSRSEDRSGTLDWFRDQRGPTVLVSVGMLTEGVDLPDARTAFLARPTTSPILMRQMVGRVLRGPRAGGQSAAHVVHFRDDWRSLPDVLEPAQVLPISDRDPGEAECRGWAPGPIVDDDGLAIADDLAAQIEHAFERVKDLYDVDDDDPFNDLPLPPLDAAAELAGYYDLGDLKVPVFAHQLDGFEAILADADADFRGWAFMSYFDDLAPPFPTQGAVRAVVEFAREQGQAPAFVPMKLTMGPGRAADEIQHQELSDSGRAEVIRRHFERSANRAAYRTLDAFEDAVHTELRQRRKVTRRLEDAMRLPRVDPSTLPKLPRASRDLRVLARWTVEEARVLLPAGFQSRLVVVPEVLWTHRVVTSTWGHWSLRHAGRGKGRSSIRINRLLRAPKKHVSDEMLGYLIYHELLHHLLPGQSHDTQFRDLEALWPDAERWDLEFDTLHERYDTRPESYRHDLYQAGDGWS